MRRTALAVAALLAASTPVLAAGSFITRNIQDGSGFHTQSYYDESGVGTGPFDPVYSLPSGVSAGGGSGGTVNQGTAGTTPWLTTLYQGGGALSATNPIFTQLTTSSAVVGLVGQSGAWTVSLGSGSATFGSIANTGFNALQGGAANASGNPFFAQITNFPATQAVSGTVTANLGTLNGAATAANQTNVQSAAGTTAGTLLSVQGSTSGVALPVSGTVAATQSGAPWSFNLTQLAGTALGAPTAYGTAPTGNVTGVNANVTASALPTGASTAANQATEITSLQKLSGAVLAPGGGNVLVLNATSNFTDTTTVLAASATFSGTSHNSGYGVPGPAPYAYFTAVAYADVAGTVFVQGSLDGTNFYPMNGTAGTAVAAGATVTVKVPAPMNIMRVNYTNGGAAQTKFMLSSMFSVN